MGIFSDFEYIKIPVLHLPITFIKKAIFGRTPYWRQYFWNKWGFLEKGLIKDVKGKKVFWVSAISGGELTQAVLFLKKLKEKHPDHKIILATDSYDAFHYAKKISLADYVIDAPWDISIVVKRCLSLIHPEAIIHIENAYYVKLMEEAKSRGIKNILISARMNPTMLKAHVLFRRAEKLRFYQYLDFIGVKAEEDKKNYIDLGCQEQNIYVLGDLKYDLEYLHMNVSQEMELKRNLGIGLSDRVFTAGSIHAMEFGLVIGAYLKAREEISELKLIIVPRWYYEIKGLIKILKDKNLKYQFRSKELDNSDFDCLIIDTFGELSMIYGISDAVYIGNSVMPINERGAGHNIIEALVHGKPIIFGAYMYSWRSIVAEIKKVCPACEVHNKEELAQRAIDFIIDSETKSKLEKLSKRISLEYSGAVNKYLQFIEDTVK